MDRSYFELYGRKLKAARDELGAAREDRDLFPSDLDHPLSESSDLPGGIPATVLVHEKEEKGGSQLNYCEDDMRKEYKRIEDEIARLPKFSDIWFALKEELVELRASLEQNERETEAEEPIVTTKRIRATPKRGRRHCNDGRKHQQQQQRNPQNSPLNAESLGARQISPPPSPPVSPLNPSPYCSKSSGHIRLYSFDSSTTPVDPDTVATIQRLKLDHERLSSELSALPANSKEWRDIKWRTINLEEQLDDIENSSNSNSNSTCGRSGWSSHWSDEEEILSHTDSTELSLVMEALALQNRTSYPASQEEQCVSATKIQSMMRQRLACRKLAQLKVEPSRRAARENEPSEKRAAEQAANRAEQTQQFGSLSDEEYDEKAMEQYNAMTTEEACGDVDTKHLDLQSAHRQFETNAHLSPIKTPRQISQKDSPHSMDIDKFKERLEANAVAPIFPEDEFKRCRNNRVAERLQKANAKNVGSTIIKEDEATKKVLTPQEQIRSLSQECMRLSRRLHSLPRFSPEWTLTKVEMGFVTEEMEFFYQESLRKGQPL